MLAELKFTISTEADERLLSYRKASIFQSVMMEKISPQYAEILHMENRRPYSQTVYYEKGLTYWIVRTFSDEAYKEIIEPLMDPTWTEFYLEHIQKQVFIRKRELSTMTVDELMKDFYTRKDSPYISIRFVTPTAFKQNNSYVNMPDVRLIYQSLMNKCTASIEGIDFYDEETLEDLCEHTKIVKYQLRSASFPLSGANIPAFVGEVQLHVKGNPVMINFANLLVSLGYYTGIGIKTAIGMGNIETQGGRRDD